MLCTYNQKCLHQFSVAYFQVSVVGTVTWVIFFTSLWSGLIRGATELQLKLTPHPGASQEKCVTACCSSVVARIQCPEFWYICKWMSLLPSVLLQKIFPSHPLARKTFGACSKNPTRNLIWSSATKAFLTCPRRVGLPGGRRMFGCSRDSSSIPARPEEAGSATYGWVVVPPALRMFW